ncbi:MAG TPA: phospholipase D-like domain-containing protein [Vicinamibacterales bacterium]|nr:phospholipase D-like domain-containing protein [Vicinamibacterales bacterium]
MEPVSTLAVLVLLVALFIWGGIVALATPTVAYRFDRRFHLASPAFDHALSSVLATRMARGNRIVRFENGEQFYPEMLSAIVGAQRSISLECYIFHPGKIGDAFTAALAERATAGVPVRIVLDAFGSRRLRRRCVRRLAEAGCQIAWHPRSRWRRAHRLTNSTHREILVVDGRMAFTGGAGISEWWASAYKGQPPWRDTMVRVEGPAVADVQAVFAENWLECDGAILAGDEWFPPLGPCGTSDALVTKNSPSFDGSRALLQALVECASSEIRLTTPYFLPDPSLLSALIQRARSGVAVTILVPGRRMDHPWVRLSSRRLFRPLLDAGIRIFEYQPSMIHQKLMIVDGLWAVVGTTNLDMLSFEYLDEINIAVRDVAFAREWQARHDADLAQSIELESSWHRPVSEKALAWLVWTLAGQRWALRFRRPRVPAFRAT